MNQDRKALPAYPLSVEVAPYASAGEPGHRDTPITREAFEEGERFCVARVSFVDAAGFRASAFVAVVLADDGSLVLEVNQDQREFLPRERGSIVSRSFPLRLFGAPKRPTCILHRGAHAEAECPADKDQPNAAGGVS